MELDQMELDQMGVVAPAPLGLDQMGVAQMDAGVHANQLGLHRFDYGGAGPQTWPEDPGGLP
ncbi:hypothetical protein, partial [Micromonospora fulviviridis]